MDTEKPSSMEKQLNKWLSITAIFGTLLLAFYFWWFHHLNKLLSTDSQDWSAIGEYFNGFVSPILSFIMIMAVTKTITLQRQLIIEQRQQMFNSNNLMRVGTAIQGITSLMHYHQNNIKIFSEFNEKKEQYLISAQQEINWLTNPGITTNIGNPETRIKILNDAMEITRSKITKNKDLISAYTKIVGACSQAILRLSLSTPSTAEVDISTTASLINNSIKEHLLPLAETTQKP